MNLREYELALGTLEAYIEEKADHVSYRVVKDAPNTYSAMVQFRNQHGYFGINGEASDTSIYTNKNFNIQFRAIHDKMHYDLGLTFSFKDEKTLSDITASKVSNWAEDQGSNEMECYNLRLLINAEITGQIEFFEQTGEYLENQEEFIKQYLNVKEA